MMPLRLSRHCALCLLLTALPIFNEVVSAQPRTSPKATSARTETAWETQPPSNREQAVLLMESAKRDFYQGEFGTAEEKLRRSLHLAEDVYETHFWMGRIHTTRAASSPAEREKAIAEFRRAIELQPYTEHADIARAWLTRVAGRPKSIRFVVVQPEGKLQLDRSASQKLIESLTYSAQADGFKPEKGEGRPIALDENKTEELIKSCRDSTGTLSVGWLVGIAAGTLQSSRASKGGYSTRVSGQVQIFDPLSGQLWQPREISGSSANLFSALLGLKAKNSSESRSEAYEDLSRAAWNRCSEVIAAQADPQLLDEVQIPTGIEGISARAATAYDEATTMPVVMMFGSTHSAASLESDAIGVTRQIDEDLSRELLVSKRMALISPGNARGALKECNFPGDSGDEEELREVGRRANCRVVLIPSLVKFDLDQKNYVLARKIIARVGLRMRVLDCDSDRVLLDKTFEKSESATKFLSGDDVKGLLKKRALILNQVISDTARAVLLLPAVQAGFTASPIQRSPILAMEPAQPVISQPRKVDFGSPLKVIRTETVAVVMAPVPGFATWARATVRQTNEETFVKRGEFSVQFRHGSAQATVNGRNITMAAPAAFHSGVLYAPLGNLAEGVGASAELDSGQRTVRLSGLGRESFVDLP